MSMATSQQSGHAALPALIGADAWELRLPRSFGTHAMLCRAAVAQHLRTGNESALVRAIAEAADTLATEELPLACWIPCLMGFEEARGRGLTFACSSMVAHYIAVSARAALLRSRISVNAPWLVGRTMIDQSAAHLIALLQVRRGISVRPWWAPDMPRRGSYLLVSAGDVEGALTRCSRCIGVLSLVEEARRETQRLEDAALECGRRGPLGQATPGSIARAAGDRHPTAAWGCVAGC